MNCVIEASSVLIDRSGTAFSLNSSTHIAIHLAVGMLFVRTMLRIQPVDAAAS
jgi:hypothetical protein